MLRLGVTFCQCSWLASLVWLALAHKGWVHRDKTTIKPNIEVFFNIGMLF